MKIAVLSDIHSNYYAFQACVSHALTMKVDGFLFLGDYVSDCAYPQKTMKLSWDVELIQLDYDKHYVVKELRDSGLQEAARIWAKLVEETILTGIDRSWDCLHLALKKSYLEEGTADWSALKEKYWEEAALEMGII